jgi:chitinase
MLFSLSSVSAGAVAITLLLSHQATAIEGGSDNLNSYLAAHPVPTKAAGPPLVSNDTIPPKLADLALSRCPIGCDESGSNSGNWTLYPRLGRLSICNETMLLDFPLYSSLREDETIRACTAGNNTSSTEGASSASNSTSSRLRARDAGNSTSSTAGVGSAGNSTSNGSCLPNGSLTQVQESLQLAFNETSIPATTEDFEAAATKLAAALSQRDSNCTDITSFSYANTVALGIFVGPGVQYIAASVLQEFITKINDTGFSNSVIAQLCAKDGRSSKYSFGIAVSGDRDVPLVQDAVATWASGECVTSYDNAEPWQAITLSVPSLLSNGTSGNSTAGSSNGTAGAFPLKSRNSNMFHRRAPCSTIQVVSGDSCEYSWQNLP